MKSILLSSAILLLLGLGAGAQISSVEGWVPQYINSAAQHPTYSNWLDNSKYYADKNYRFNFDYPKEYMPDDCILDRKTIVTYTLEIGGVEVSTISINSPDYLGGRYLIKRETGEEFFNKLEGHDPKKTKTLAKLHASYLETYGDATYITDYDQQSVKKELGTDYIYASRISKTENETSFFAIIKQHPLSKDFYGITLKWKNNYNQSGIFDAISAKLKASFKPRPLAPNEVEDAGGNVYKTLKIGTQSWLSENLRAEYFQQGRIEISEGNSDKVPAYLVFNNKRGETTNTGYGRFYNHLALSDPRGICPKGWRIPSKADYEKLATELQKINWTNKMDIDSNNKEIINFYSQGGGYSINANGDKFYSGNSSILWTSSPASAGKIWAVSFRYESAQITFQEVDKTEMLACRCVL